MNPMQDPTGKQRSQRIQIDYYKHPTKLDRWRNRCVGLAVALGSGYAIYLLLTLDSAGGGVHLNTGPLASVHASFEHDCRQCHRDFTPMDPDAPHRWLTAVGMEADLAREHVEAACQKCHPVGGHHPGRLHQSVAETEQRCAVCHRDHRGRDRELAQVDQQQCTTCHADLASAMTGPPVVKPNVDHFDSESHGDFDSLLSGDPGRIRFSHHQHLLPGQVPSDVRGGMTVGQLPQEDQGRYRRVGQKSASLVQLDCSSCHQLMGEPWISNDPGNLQAVDVAMLGRSMSPVRFEEHCSACHAISSGVAANSVSPTLPHAASWEQVQRLLAATIRGGRVGGQMRQRRDDSQPTPLPGVGFGTAGPSSVDSSPGELAAARKRVEQQCLECHEPAGITQDAILASRAGKLPPMIPRRWLRRGIYDHRAHRSIDCRLCHADAFPDLESSDGNRFDFQDHQRVMIAGIETCVGCHRPAGTPMPEPLVALTIWPDRNPDDADTTVIDGRSGAGRLPRGILGGMATWGSDQCITCHRYHSPFPEPLEQSNAQKLTSVTTQPLSRRLSDSAGSSDPSSTNEDP